MPNPFEEFGGIADSDLYKENPSQANTDPFAEFGGFSDSSINGTAQQQSSVNKRITTPSKPNPTFVQPPVINTPEQAQQTIPEPAPQPLYANNGIIQGGIANEPDYAKPQNAFLVNIDDKIKQQAKLNLEKRVAWEKAHPIISDFQKSLQPNYSANALDWEKKAQYGAVSPLKENLQNQFKQIRSNIAPSVNLATLGVGGEYAFAQGAKILNNARKFKPVAQFIASHPYLSRWASVAPFTMAEGAGWGIADKALRNASGVESNESWKDAAIGGAATMGLLHGGIMGGAALANNIAKSTPAKAAAKAYNNLLNSNTPIGNRLANIQGTLADTLGLDAANETARKYQKLNRDISRGNVPLEKRLSKTDVEELEASKNLTKKQQDLIFDRLKNGEPKKSTVTKEQEDAKEFFDNLLKEEEANIKPEHAGDDLSQVKQEPDTSLPEHIETPLKIDSDMSGDKYKINLRDEKSEKQNYFKIQQEKWKRQQQRMDAEKHQPEFNQKEYKAKVERIRARMEAAKEGNIVKFDEDGLEALGKEMGDWVHPKKQTITKLEAGSAEGSESGNWYVHEAQAKPKALGADNLYESYVDDIKPTTDEELMKEIADARKGKQLPSVNKPFVNKSSAMKRWKDRIENEKAQMSWKQKLRSRVKAINSDFEEDTKTLGELIYGNPKNSGTSNTAYSHDYYGKMSITEGKFVSKGGKAQVKYREAKIGDAVKSDGLLREIFEPIKDVKIKYLNVRRSDGVNGYYDKNTDSIKIFKNCKEPIETLLHESRHALQERIAETLKKITPKYRKLVDSGYRRNREYNDYIGNPYNRKILDKVIPLAKKLDDGIITETDFIKQVSRQEYIVFDKFIGLETRYRECYIERDARAFAEGDYGKKLFGKDVYELGDLAKDRSIGKLRRFDKSRTYSSGYRTREHVWDKSSKVNYEEPRSRRTGSNRNTAQKNEQVGYNVQSTQHGEQRLAPTPQSFIKSIKNSSKAQEQIKIDFDIITEEQAANRIKLQSGGEGVYFKQGYGKSDSKIDLTKNYNESRDNKVGHFGEKIKDGLANGSTTKDILLETKKEEIKVQHLKDSIDFIESEFAKALPESGNASKGYVAVNRNLLANAIYGKKSTAWYEMMSKVIDKQGEEAIKKSFKNEKTAQNWIELAKRNSKPDYQIPDIVFNKLFDGSGETVAEYWERYGKDHTSKAIAKTAGAILDAFNNSFKRGVLTSASFVFNNRFGNQMMIAAKSNPVEYIKSFYQAGKLKNKDLPEEIIESSLLEAVEGYKARQTYTGWQPLDNFLNLCGGHTIDTSTLKTMKAASDNGLHFQVIKGKTIPKKMVESHNAKSLAAEAANICIGMPNKAFNKLCDKLMRFNEAMERFERKQVYGIQMDRVKKDIVKRTGQNMLTQEEFLSHLKNHPELEETIVKNIEDTLGDYNNFNKFEKKVLKRIVPFYSWYRTISRHTVTLAKENPARCAMIFLELERLKDKDEDLKEWQKGAIRTGLYDSRSNRELLVNKTAQIPYSTFKEFVDESGRGGLSPAVKKPLEALRGKQFFNDSEITSKRYKKSKKGWGVNAREGYLDKNTGTFKEGELPLMPRINYLGKEALNTVYPALRSPLLKPEATAQGINNLILNGEYKEPDKLYDSDLGGYNKNDVFWGNEKRWAANDTSTITKTLNRILGLSLQNKQPLSKAEREALKEKYLRQYRLMNKY